MTTERLNLLKKISLNKTFIRFLLILTFISVVPGYAVTVNLSAANARLMLILAAEKYLGTPYVYGGIDSRGLDCSGLIYASFKDSLNITVPRTADGLYSWTIRIPNEEMKPGDLVFFITSGPGISHVGIFAGDGYFIHAPSDGPNTGVIYSRLTESYWNRTFAGAGRAIPWE